MPNLSQRLGTGAVPHEFAIAYLRRKDGLVHSYTVLGTARQVETELFNLGLPLALDPYVAVGYRDPDGEEHIVVNKDRGNELKFEVERLLEPDA